MKTTLSSKGQVVIPAELRKRYHLREGDTLLVREDEAGCIILEPKRRLADGPRQVTSPVDGRPAFRMEGLPPLTLEQVNALRDG